MPLAKREYASAQARKALSASLAEVSQTRCADGRALLHQGLIQVEDTLLHAVISLPKSVFHLAIRSVRCCWSAVQVAYSEDSCGVARTFPARASMRTVRLIVSADFLP